MSEQTATIETGVTASDLLDTVHASVSALTTLVSLTDVSGLQTLGDMAHSLTESKAPAYIGLLPADDQDTARFNLGLDRTNFVAAFADAQYNAMLIDLDTYVARLGAFDALNKDQDSTTLCSEAEARTELVLSVLPRFEGSPDLPAETCWRQLTHAQDLYSKAAKLNSVAQIYLSRGDVELLRHRLAQNTQVQLSGNLRKSAPMLAQNAQTYYKGAARLATSEEDELKVKSEQRIWLAVYMRSLLYGFEPEKEGVASFNRSDLESALSEAVQEGLVDAMMANEIASRVMVAKS